MLATPRRPAWLIWLLVGIVAGLGYLVLPGFEPTTVFALLVDVAAAVVTVFGIRRHRPADLRAWLIFAAGQVLWVLADVTFVVKELLGLGNPFPSLPDAFYLCAYPLLALGLFRISRERWLRRSAGIIDSAIIAISLTTVYWVFVIGPIATDATMPVLTRLVMIGYPTAGVVLFAVVAPMVVRPGRRTASRWLLTAGGALTLTCNVAYSLFPAFLADSGEMVYTGYLIANVCWAAAALHPSMRTPQTGPAQENFGRARLVLLASAMLLVPAVMLIRRTESMRHLGWLVVGLGSAMLIVLVLARLFGFVAEVQKQARRLGALAMHDDLTGLANRRSFEQSVRTAMTTGSPQVAVVDLADFKNINDRFGRAVADRALVAVADLLARTVAGRIVVARIGGDEFALLIPDATADEADALVRQVVEGLRRPLLVGEDELLLNARVGMAGSEGVADAGELLRRADTALDATKTAGTRFRRYRVELDEHADQAARLGADLRHALDDEQFRLVYQPIVALPEGRTVAVEALVRWQHPVRGLVSPVEFVPVAERNGLIVELGAWIMRTACAQAAQWQATLGPAAPRYVSVNVSALQLAQPDFAGFVDSVLRTTGLSSCQLLVEVTETAVFGGGVAVETLEQLRALGIRIALDDFGTGHSSLGLLQTVPVDVLKVDKSFVDNVTMAGRHAVLAEALIKVSNGLGLDAVAEGVETVEQADELYRLGYRLAQGYHFGRPVAEPVFECPPVQVHAA
ncbi:putative bifunctional diguanylate cyclase/phosphodiesterase [Micromonosporaceae bacterium Da 78-11]